MTFLQLSLDSFTASASNSKPWMHGNIKSPPNGKSSLRNIPISKFPQPLAQIPASSLRSSTISKWLYPVWTNVGFFKKKGFFKQKKSNLFQKISFETQIFNFPFLFNRLSTPSKKLGEQLKNTMSDQETVEPLFHLNKVILIRRPQRFASTRISN